MFQIFDSPVNCMEYGEISDQCIHHCLLVFLLPFFFYLKEGSRRFSVML